jgi:hypothetical protein
MTPIRPEQIFNAIQAGWTADAILFPAVTTFNGLRNQQFHSKVQNPADPEFLRVVELTRKLRGPISSSRRRPFPIPPISGCSRCA